MRYNPPDQLIGRNEKAVLHIGMAEIGLRREEYEAILWGAAKVTSSRDLTYRGYERVLDRFEELGFKPTSSPSPRSGRGGAGGEGSKRKRRPPLPPNMIELPSKEQIGMIKALAGDIKWRVGCQDFLKRRFGFDRPRTKAEAAKVIEALKSMAKRRQGGKP